MDPYKLLYGKDCRFGLFVHWGIYALTEYHEQVLRRTDTPREEYEKLADQFNPTAFSAEHWVKLAYDAGMRYLCLTTKHHDGFCLWDTKETDYNVMHTPFKRDIVKEFADACAKYDMRLALYYSIPDWHHPNAYNPLSSHQIPPRATDEPDMEKYVAFVKRQITELLTGYGKICALFWDISPKIHDPSLNELARKLQPGIMINDRGFDAGDFFTPERSVPAGAFTRLTEGCQSVGRQSWGYRKNEDYYTQRFLEASMDSILSKGGNYLLNIGPMPDGSMHPKAEKLLRSVGSWYLRVKESYDGDYPTALFADRKDFTVTQNGNSLYLHFNAPPEADGICLYPVNFLPESVTVLNTGETPIVALDAIPTIFDQPNGKKPFLHIYNIPFEELNSQIPVLRLTFKDLTQVENVMQSFEMKESRF